MPKAAIGFLIGFGFFLWILGLLFGKTFIWFIGFLMMAGGFYLGLKPDGILRREQVLDTWSTLIEKGQGNADPIFQDTELFIKESKAPSIHMEKKAIVPE